MLRAVIIDDVEKIRQKNIGIITEFCPEVTIVGEAHSVATALTCIKTHSPDLVFLDVELGDGLAFELLKQLEPINFKIIFITAHQEFALKAFRFSAVDFLLKPIDVTELVEAVKKASQNFQKDSMDLKMNALFTNIEKPNQFKKIILKTTERIYSIGIQDIIRCESFKNYTQFYLVNGQKVLASTNLKEYDELLSSLGFFRAHQSHLINMTYFDYYLKTDGGYVIMKDKSKVPLATRKKEELLQLIVS